MIRGLLISSAQAVFAKPKTDAADSEPADDKISGPDDAVEMLILQELGAITISRPPLR